MGDAQSIPKKTTLDDSAERIAPIGTPDANAVQPLAPPGSLGFDSKEVLRDMGSKIQLSIRCEDLVKICHTFVVVYCKWSHDEHWKEVGMSDINTANTKNPVYDPSFTVEFRAEAQCLVRFEVYKVRDRYCVDELVCQKFIGAAEAVLVDLMMARSQGNGWLTTELLNPKPKIGAPAPGRIAVFAEEESKAKYMVSFTMIAKGLKSTFFWKQKADPYAVIHRTLAIPNVHREFDFDDDPEPETVLRCTPVYHTEVARHTNWPKFKRIELSSAQLCQNNERQEILIELFDWFRTTRHRYVGESVITFADLYKAWRSSKPVVVPISMREGVRTPHTSAASREHGSQRAKTTATSDSFDRSSSKLSRSSRSSSQRGGSSNTETASLGLTTSYRGTPSRVTPKDSHGQSESSVAQMSFPVSEASSFQDQQAVQRVFGRMVGVLRLEDVGMERRYSFLDYIRGGLELRLTVAIDFTRSNISPNNPHSYHSIQSDRPSAYATAIRAVGDVMQSYDTENKYPVYGFGAKIPPSHTVCSDCFALTGDFFDPEVVGVEGILRAYQRALQVVRLHGPTHLAEVIKLTANLAAPYKEATAKNEKSVEMRYYLLAIITDGEIDDEMETVCQVLEAASLPMSIVIIGIGDQGFSFLKELASDVGACRREEEQRSGSSVAKEDSTTSFMPRRGFSRALTTRSEILSGPGRDIVHFVSYEEYRDRPNELAAAALAELPKEVVGYFTARGVKPRGLNKMEDENGNPIGKVVPTQDRRTRTGTASKVPPGSSSGSKQTTTGAVISSSASNAGNSNTGTQSRASTHMSSSGENQSLSVGSRRAESRLKQKLDKLPEFIRHERERLIQEAVDLGYDKPLVLRALRDGVPSNTIEVLVDNIVHAGYGKSPAYRDAAEATLVDMEVLLPGQPAPHRAGSTSTPVPTVGHSPAPRSLSGGSLATSEGPRGQTRSADSRNLLTVRKATKDDLRKPSTESSRGPSRGAAKDEGRRGSSSKSILVQSGEGSKKELKHSISFNFEKDEGEERSMQFSMPLPRINSEPALSDGSQTLRAAGHVPHAHAVGIAPQRTHGTDAGTSLCRICLDAPTATELQPCLHRVACADCAAKLGITCPLCQGIVRGVRQLPLP